MCRNSIHKKIDMPEFEEQTLKVKDIKKARKNYIISKFPDEDFVKNTILNVHNEFGKLGFKVIKNNIYAKEQTPADALIENLKDTLQEALFNGKES